MDSISAEKIRPKSNSVVLLLGVAMMVNPTRILMYQRSAEDHEFVEQRAVQLYGRHLRHIAFFVPQLQPALSICLCAARRCSYLGLVCLILP